MQHKIIEGRQVIGSLGRILNGRNISMGMKRGLRNSIVLPTLMDALKTWIWNRSHHSRINAVKMSYLRGACHDK